MSAKVKHFVKAYLNLNASEKMKVVEILRALQGAGGQINESQIIKSFGLEDVRGTTINFAPTPGSCPTCGK